MLLYVVPSHVVAGILIADHLAGAVETTLDKRLVEYLTTETTLPGTESSSTRGRPLLPA